MARQPQALTCNICSRVLNVADDPTTKDCGGDCLRCMAEAGDPDCIKAMVALHADFEGSEHESS